MTTLLQRVHRRGAHAKKHCFPFLSWLRFWGGSGLQVGAKIHQNLSKRVSKIRYDFEWILDGSWTDFGSILEAKLDLKSVQEGVETDVKK